MVTHMVTAVLLGLCFWDLCRRSLALVAGRLSITNAYSSDMLPDIWVLLPTLAGFSVQIYAYRCTIHALNECCRTKHLQFALQCIKPKNCQCLLSHKVRQEKACMCTIYLLLNFPRYFKFLPLSL